MKNKENKGKKSKEGGNNKSKRTVQREGVKCCSPRQLEMYPKITPQISRRNSLGIRRPSTPVPTRPPTQRYSIATNYQKKTNSCFKYCSSTKQNDFKPHYEVKCMSSKPIFSSMKPMRSPRVSLTARPQKVKLVLLSNSNSGEKKKQKKIKPVRHKITDGKSKEDVEDEQILKNSFKCVEFHRDLGRGTHSVVKSGVDWVSRRKIAVKKYITNRQSTALHERIKREVEILGSLDHPNIIKLYELVQANKSISLVLEYGGGNSLDQLIRSKPTAKIDQHSAKLIFKPLLQAVEYLHSKDIAHRNISAKTILLNKHLHLKIIGFGHSLKGVSNSTLCRHQNGLAPESIQKRSYDGKCLDRWSLGELLYNMLHGEGPFEASTAEQSALRRIKLHYACSTQISEEAKQLIAEFLRLSPQTRITPKQALMSKWMTNQLH